MKKSVSQIKKPIKMNRKTQSAQKAESIKLASNEWCCENQDIGGCSKIAYALFVCCQLIKWINKNCGLKSLISHVLHMQNGIIEVVSFAETYWIGVGNWWVKATAHLSLQSNLFHSLTPFHNDLLEQTRSGVNFGQNMRQFFTKWAHPKMRQQ